VTDTAPRIEPGPPPRPTRLVDVDHDGKTYQAAHLAEPGAEALWQISENRGGKTVPVVTVVAGQLDQALADLDKVATIQRGYARPHLDRADEADRQRALVAALADTLAVDPAAEVEPEPKPAEPRVKPGKVS
jgi:hypothetical protein